MRARSIYRNIGPLLLYLALSFLFFGRALIGHFTTFHIGVSEDPSLMMWFLVWWPHAIGSHLNLMLTDAIWAPLGINLAWETALPLLSLIAAPLTCSLGPIAALNTLCLIGPALSAWSAYILCRYLTGKIWPALVGGYLFGFSPFIAGHMTYAHLDLLFVFPVPLICYYSLRRFNDDISSHKFIILLTSCLVAQFLIFIEVFATMTVFGGLTLPLALGLTSDELRKRIWNLIPSLATSWALALLVVSPYLYYFLAYGFHRTPHWLGSNLSIDLLNLLIPAPSNELGLLPVFQNLSGRFNTGFLSETVGYIGWPLLIIAVLFMRNQWSDPAKKLLIYLLPIILICALGPTLIFRGEATRIRLPWALFEVPVLNNAGPGRFMIYAFLDLAVIAALWLSEADWSRTLKIGLAVAAIASLLPNLSAGFWVSPADRVPFFSSGTYRRYLSRNETVLILPYGLRGETMYWQAETNMYFRMAQGASHAPGDFNVWPIHSAFEMQTFVPNASAQLRAFIDAHDISTVIVTAHSYDRWRPLLSTLHIDPIPVAGVYLYRVPAPIRASASPTLLEMRTDFDSSRFEEVVLGVQRYLSLGGSLRALRARNAPALGIIPSASLIGPAEPYSFLRDPQHNWYSSPDFQYGMALFPLGDNQIAIGEVAWAPAVSGLIAKYRLFATRADIEVPKNSNITAARSDALGRFVMVFDRQGLERAAALAAPSLKEP